MLVGLFGLGDFAFVFVGLGETDGGDFVGGVEAEGEREFGGGFGRVSGAVVDQAEADVAGGSGVAQFDGVLAIGFGGSGPLLLFGVGIFESVSFAEDGFGHAEVGIELEGFAGHEDRVHNVIGWNIRLTPHRVARTRGFGFLLMERLLRPPARTARPPS